LQDVNVQDFVPSIKPKEFFLVKNKKLTLKYIWGNKEKWFEQEF
jgi:hypothetical protein